MSPRIFALWGGIAMIVLAAVAFFMPGSVEGLPPLLVDYSYGLFLGLVPMNIVTKAALLLFGVLGIWCAMSPNVSLPRSIWYCRLVFVSMAVLMVLGLFAFNQYVVWLLALVRRRRGFPRHCRRDRWFLRLRFELARSRRSHRQTLATRKLGSLII